MKKSICGQSSIKKSFFINDKKPIYQIQIGEKYYIINANNLDIAFLKATKEHFGKVGVLIRGRKMKIKINKFIQDSSWRYISSQYIFRRRLKEIDVKKF